jgi:predicted anti-sigma-YlaC factor YlaD
MVNRNPACDRARARASSELDDELSEFDRCLLERHLERCHECRVVVADMFEMTAALRSAPLVQHVCGRVVPHRARLYRARQLASIAAALVLVSTVAATLVTRGSPRAPRLPAPADATFLAPVTAAAQIRRAENANVRIKLPIGQRSALPEFQPPPTEPPPRLHGP